MKPAQRHTKPRMRERLRMRELAVAVGSMGCGKAPGPALDTQFYLGPGMGAVVLDAKPEAPQGSDSDTPNGDSGR